MSKTKATTMYAVATRYDFFIKLNSLKQAFSVITYDYFNGNGATIAKWLSEADMIASAIDPDGSASIYCLEQQHKLSELTRKTQLGVSDIKEFRENCIKLVNLIMQELKTFTS